MNKLLSLFSVLAGFIFAFVAFVLSANMLVALLTSHSLTMRIGHHYVSTATLGGKLVGALLCCVLFWLAGLLVVSFPNRLRSNHAA